MTGHALHASIAAVVEPFEGKVVHEEHARLLVGRGLDLDAAETAEGVREIDVLELAALEGGACRDFDLSVVRRHLVAELAVPGPASGIEDARLRAVVVASEPGACGVEPKCGLTVVGAVGDLTSLGTRCVG